MVIPYTNCTEFSRVFIRLGKAILESYIDSLPLHIPNDPNEILEPIPL